MLGARASAVTEALEQRTREFNDVLGARSGELPRSSTAATFSCAPSISAAAHREMVVTRSDQAARTLIESGEQVAAAFASTNDHLRTDVTDIVERLSRSNDLLTGLLGTTQENLAKIETNLASRSQEFGSTIIHAVESTQLSASELGNQVHQAHRRLARDLDGVSTW
jgi:hypothetical protein